MWFIAIKKESLCYRNAWLTLLPQKCEPKENYINQLLSNFFQVENIAFIN
jgi:hypothetical protein